MRKITSAVLFLAVAAMATPSPAAELPAAPPQSRVDSKTPAKQSYPVIVLYSVAWCPHCKEAKEYFAKNSIPFTNRDVEIDQKAMDELIGKYRSQGVPVVVIGDRKVLKGFSPEAFEKAVKEFQK